MKTISLNVDDETDAALTAVCAERGRSKTELVADVLRKYLQSERLKRTLQDPALSKLYQELAGEDLALAEEGMSDYQRMLEQADKT